MLAARGYDVVHVRSGWEPTESNRFATETIPCGPFSEFVTTLARGSILAALDGWVPILSAGLASKIDCAFSAIGTPRGGRPVALFAHILSPHPPFIFRADGSVVAKGAVVASGQDWNDKEAYLQELTYVGRRMIRELTTLLADSARPRVVVLLSDHGPAFNASWERPTPAFLRERMGNLLAVYSSEGPVPDFSARSPINLFPLILNRYFQAELPLRADTAYFSTYENPYAFTEVPAALLDVTPEPRVH